MTRRRSLLAHQGAATAAEFALVLPLTLLLLFGIVDVGRLMYILNRAEKATQVGVRMAVVTNPVSPDLIAADYASGSIAPGASIPADQLGRLTCTSTGCTCVTPPCPSGGGGVDAAAHGLLVARMDDFLDGLTANNVAVSYLGSGFGSAGDPTGSGGGGGGGAGGAAETMEISPLVTVSLTNVRFRPITGLLLMSFTLPPFSSTLPAEDASGTVSN